MAARKKNPAYKTSGVSVSLRQDQIDHILETGSSPSKVARDAIDQHFGLTPPPEYIPEPKKRSKKKST